MAIGFFQPLWEKRAILPFALDRLCLGCKCRLHNTNTYPAHTAKIDSNENWLPKERTIQNFNIDALGFRKTRNENHPTQEIGITS